MLPQHRKGTASSRTQSAAKPINRGEVLRRCRVRDSLNSPRGCKSGHWGVSLMCRFKVAFNPVLQRVGCEAWGSTLLGCWKHSSR